MLKCGGGGGGRRAQWKKLTTIINELSNDSYYVEGESIAIAYPDLYSSSINQSNPMCNSPYITSVMEKRYETHDSTYIAMQSSSNNTNCQVTQTKSAVKMARMH